MAAARRLPKATLEELAGAKILGIRAGTEHQYTGVWVVVVGGRAFVRSWNNTPTGWYRAFRAEPVASIQLGGREIPIRAQPVRGERLRDAVTQTYSEKFKTRASEKWVRGFAPGRLDAGAPARLGLAALASRARAAPRGRFAHTPDE
jgi:hypothetical protein